MTDTEFAAAFEAGEVLPEDFRHREHLRLAWVCVQEAGDVHAAGERIKRLIRQFAAAAGHPGKYHETLTIFWVRLLAELKARCGDIPFAAVIADNPEILDKDFVLRFYPREVLFSDKARHEWIAPPLATPAPHAAEAHPCLAAGHARRGPVPGAA
jgi:hypothetical protein